MRNNDCWYFNVCSNECTGCIRYLEMSELLEKSNLPKSKWKPISLTPDDCDYDAFCTLADIKSDINNFVKSGKNLFLYSGSTGNGKTTWSIKLLLKYFDTVWAGNGFRCRGLFIHIPTFLTQLKNFTATNDELERIKNDLNTADLVIWDDIASTGLTNFDNSQLLTFIDSRILNEKSNIYTSNVGIDNLEKSIGSRLASRVWNNSLKVELKGWDKRNGSTSNNF